MRHQYTGKVKNVLFNIKQQSIFNKIIMIINRQITNACRNLQTIKYSYINQRDLHHYLKNTSSDTTFGKIKYTLYYIRFIMKQGLSECKDDLKWLYKNSLNKQFKTKQDLEKYYRIKKDMGKLMVPFILNLLPMGSLLIILLIKYSPETLPSWIQIDQDELERQVAYKQIKQKVRYQYDVSSIDFKTASLKELKILSLATTGRVVDGTIILNRMTGSDFNITQGPMSYLSAWLLRRHIRKYLDHNILLHEEQDKTLEEKICIVLDKK